MAAESHFAEDHSVVFSESKLITRFQTLTFPANTGRTRELENWKKKNCPNSTTERSSTESRPLLQRCFGSIRTEFNCQTSSFLDFPLKIYSASLGFCKTCLSKGRRNCRGVSLLRICTSKEQSRTKQQTAVTGWLGVTELLNLQLVCFPTSYGTIYVCFHSRFCRICFDRATVHLFVCFVEL